MSWLYLVVFILIAAFGLTVLFGPPYVPTLKRQAEAALDLLDLKPGQVMLELGSGDGRVMLAAAKRGLNVVGIELNPLLVVYSQVACWRYRKQVRVIWGSYFQVRWPRADAIFVFALPRLMSRLDKKIETWHSQPLRFASFAFEIPGKKLAKQAEGVFLYEYK